MPRAIDHLSKYEVAPDGCWNFTGYVYPKGYGKAGRSGYAHRWFYVNHVGPIPSGMEIDHLCRNRRCVNPEHLEAVTHAANVRRSEGLGPLNTAKTHCPQGHEYTPDNLVAGQPGRRCKTCMREKMRARRVRRALERAA